MGKYISQKNRPITRPVVAYFLKKGIPIKLPKAGYGKQ